MLIHIRDKNQTTQCGLIHIDERPRLKIACTIGEARTYAGLSVGQDRVCEKCRELVEQASG